MIVIAFLTTGCPYPMNNDTGLENVTENDFDGDGLTNLEETETWGTNPNAKDTDGDGFSDYNEIVDRNYDPSVDPYAFNPLIADTPKLGITLNEPPTIALTYTTTLGNEETYTNERTDGWSVTESSSQTRELSVAVEEFWSVTAGVETSISLSPQVKASVEATVGRSSTREQSFQWTDQQESSNSATITGGESFAQSNEIETTGGYMAIPVTVKNEGHLTFTVENLILTANELLRGSSGSGAINPIANLEYDTTKMAFQEFTLPPGSANENLFFIAELDLGTAKALLRNSSNLNVNVGSYQISGFEGRPFGFEEEIITTSTANIVIDFSGDTENIEYLVATRIDDDNPGVNLGDVMNNVLQVPFETGIYNGNNTLVSITDRRGSSDVVYENDASTNKVWTVMHSYLESGSRRSELFSGQTDFDFAGLELQAQDVVYMMYIQDGDGDGLGRRQEFLYGSDPANSDTDGDGWNDYREAIEEGTRPDSIDTDGDGLNDPDDSSPLASRFTEIAVLGITDAAGQTYLFTEDTGEYTSVDTIPGDTAIIEVETVEAVTSVKINGDEMDHPQDNQHFSYEISPAGSGSSNSASALPLGETTYQIVVTAQDISASDEWNLTIRSQLEDMNNSLTSAGTGLDGGGDMYRYDVAGDYTGYTDSRANGALLLFSYGNTDIIQIEPSDILPRTIKADGFADAAEYGNGEIAVKTWSWSGDQGPLTVDFGASYYNREYSFRMVTYGQNGDDGPYYYSPGAGVHVQTSTTTPWPSTITIESIQSRIYWRDTEGAESDPEFYINMDLDNSDGNKLDDLVYHGLDDLWRPLDDGNPLEETDYLPGDGLNFNIPGDRTATLFKIWFDIDEDDSFGEHDFVEKSIGFQFVPGADPDGLYEMYTGNKYANAIWVADSGAVYYDNDKGELDLDWEVKYRTHAVEN